MSDVIHLLPDSVANQVAAAEVIQRPASVLKELVENSIDAGATTIKIVIKDAGRTLIQVIDDGKGMSETDARMAFEKHATSKISKIEDLFDLKTMGFRGEGLTSIAAVAQVELRTKRVEDELGVMIEIAGTRVFRQEQIHSEKGTSIVVKNLFFNIPARRRFLKSDNVEKNHLINEFLRIALVYPEISFSFTDGNDELYQLPISNHRIRINNIFGKNKNKLWEQQLLSIETSTSIVTVYGYISKPEFSQKNANQYFFVNGRYMRHPYFHKAILNAYSGMIQHAESPNYFIYFQVDPQTIDVNIHPTKTEIKFENEQAIWSILSSAVRESLGKFNVVPSIDFDQDGAIQIPFLKSEKNIEVPATTFNPNYNPFNSTPNIIHKRSIDDWEKLYGDFEKPTNEKSDSSEFLSSKLNLEISTRVSDESLQQVFEVTENRATNFQYKSKYIFTSIKSGLMVIDQHRAHVRILFDQYMCQVDDKGATSQQVLFPEELILSADDDVIFKQVVKELTSVGFDFEQAEKSVYLVKGVPSLIKESSVINFLQDLLIKIKVSDSNIDTVDEIKEVISLSLAYSSAIRAGQFLSNEEMTDLINRLFASTNCNYTPDGKKIMIVFSQEEIDSRF